MLELARAWAELARLEVAEAEFAGTKLARGWSYPASGGARRS
jgi:hypothetical protein